MVPCAWTGDQLAVCSTPLVPSHGQHHFNNYYYYYGCGMGAAACAPGVLPNAAAQHLFPSLQLNGIILTNWVSFLKVARKVSTYFRFERILR